MTVKDFLENRKWFTSMLDVANALNFEKELSVDAHKNGCINCNSDKPVQDVRTNESWTAIKHCADCNKAMSIIWTDRMGGGTNDTVYVYGDKP